MTPENTPVAGNNGYPWDLWLSCLSKDLNLEALLPAWDAPEGSSKGSGLLLGHWAAKGQGEGSTEVPAPSLLCPSGRTISLAREAVRKDAELRVPDQHGLQSKTSFKTECY